MLLYSESINHDLEKKKKYIEFDKTYNAKVSNKRKYKIKYVVQVYLGNKKTPQQIPKDVHALLATQLLIT